MHKHACHLHLAVGVEGAHADVGVGEGLGGVVNLAQHLGAQQQHTAKQRQSCFRWNAVAVDPAAAVQCSDVCWTPCPAAAVLSTDVLAALSTTITMSSC